MRQGGACPIVAPPLSCHSFFWNRTQQTSSQTPHPIIPTLWFKCETRIVTQHMLSEINCKTTGGVLFTSADSSYTTVHVSLWRPQAAATSSVNGSSITRHQGQQSGRCTDTVYAQGINSGLNIPLVLSVRPIQGSNLTKTPFLLTGKGC